MNHLSFRSAAAILLAFWGVIAVLFYGKGISTMPEGHHAWAMADYYAMSLKFAENGLNLFCPQTYNLSCKDGITASDLPLPAWLSGVAMFLLGNESPAIFRILTLMAGFLGFFFFFRSICEQGVMPIRAVVLTLFFWVLPGLLYYHDNFLPSVWALSTFLIGLWALQRDIRGDKRYWVVAVAAFVLAALLRKPYILQLICVGLWQVFFRKDRKNLMILAVGMAVFALWQLYDYYLMQTYGSIFLRQTMHPENFSGAVRLAKEVWQKWGLVWLSPSHLIWIALTAALLAKRPLQGRDESNGLFPRGYFFGAMAVGISYFVLMLRQFSDHEYYAIDSFYPIIFIGVLGWARVSGDLKWVIWVEMCLLLVALGGAWGRINWYHQLGKNTAAEKTHKAYRGSAAVLDGFGISRDARMMVFEAGSANLPLVGMRRNGYCLLSSRAEVQKKTLESKPDYAVCLDTNFVSEVVQDNFSIVQNLEFVGKNSDFWAFRVGNFPGNTLEKLLANQWETVVDTSVTAAGEFLFTRSLPLQPGAKVLFYGNILIRGSGELKATLSLFKAGAPVGVLERKLRLVPSETSQFCAADLNVPNIPADEMRIYLWNPEQSNITFDRFKIVVLHPKGM